uniref:Cytochrome P450 n=1 Tax=Globodera pallida TaxID=36090 RepID=A0A183C6S7_GLOPA
MPQFVEETLRIANILPNNEHALTREVTVDGFNLPKGTAIVPQVSAVLIDDAVFSQPKRFKPERFLEQNGANSLARSLQRNTSAVMHCSPFTCRMEKRKVSLE